MIYGIYRNLRSSSWQCLVDYGIAKLPVDVLHIAKSAGVAVRRNSDVGMLSGGESGKTFLDTECNVWYIVYDDETSKARRRFVIAHELGHIFMGHEMHEESMGRSPDGKSPNWEYQADAFALRLLAPACVIWGLDKHAPDDIAAFCGIPMPESKKRADRMKVLYKRQKFLDNNLEKQVYHQFGDYIAGQKIYLPCDGKGE